MLHALLRRRFAAVQLCAELPELADLQAHLSAWCAAQGLPTALQWLDEEPESSSVVRRNIRATAQRLETLPDCGVDLVLLSSHQAAHRSGIAGSTLAPAEPPELNAAWQREALAEAFVDALAAAQPGG